MKIKPLHDWVVIRRREAEEVTAGGIVIPDMAKEKPEEGEVLAVGEGRYEEEERDKKGEKAKKKVERKFIKTVLKPGDRVLYEKYMERKVQVDDEELVLVREENVLGRFE